MTMLKIIVVRYCGECPYAQYCSIFDEGCDELEWDRVDDGHIIPKVKR